MRIHLVSLALLVFGSGCAAAPQEEAAGDSANAISEKSAYQRVVDARFFKNGHTACGRTLTVEGTNGTEGSYKLDIIPCEDGAKESHTEGHFEVRGGLLGGMLTNPTMHLIPAHEVADGAELSYEDRPWKLSIAELGDSVRLTDERGSLVPETLLD